MSRTLYSGAAAVTVQLQAGFGSGLFADPAGITWTDITDDMLSADLSLSSRTNELDDFQPGLASFTMTNRTRTYDPAYGPASVAFVAANLGHWSTPDKAAFAGATQLDVRACVAFTDWTPGAGMTIVSQWNSTGNQRAWSLDVTAAGYLQLATSVDGIASVSANSGVVVSAVDGQTLCVRATWDSSNATTFYVKRTVKGRERADCLDHDGWLMLGAVAVGSAAAIFNSTSTVDVGRRASANQYMTGSVLYADARTTIDSDTLAFAYWPKDAASSAATSWVASAGAGETWTATGTSTITVQGTYFGQLVPGVPIRCRVTYSGSTRTVFTGYVRRWPQTYPSQGMDAVARIEAADALAWLAEKPCPDSPFGMAVAAAFAEQLVADPAAVPDLYWPLHEPFPSTSFGEEGQGNGGGNFVGTSVGVSTQPGAPGLSVRAFATSADRAWTREGDPPGGIYSPTMSFWCYLPNDLTQFEVVLGGLGGMTFVNNPQGNSYVQSSAAGSDDSWYIPPVGAGWHFVQFTHIALGLMALRVDSTDVSPLSYQASLIADYSSYPRLWISGYSTAGGASVSDVSLGRGLYAAAADAYFSALGRPNELSGARMSWLLTAAGLPSALISVTTDQSTYLGPMTAGGTYLSQAKEIEAAEGGRLYVTGDGVVTFRSSVWATTATAATTSQGTFGDGDGNPPYMDITVDANNVDDLVNDATVSIPTGGSGVATNRDSVALHGIHSTSRSAPLPDTGAARNLALQLTSVRPWPTTRVEGLVVSPLAPSWAASLWPQVLDRAVGERITVVRRPTNTLVPASTTQSISAAVTIEGIRHTFDAETWRTIWTTAPAPLTAQEACLFTVDDAVLGIVDSGAVVAY